MILLNKFLIQLNQAYILYMIMHGVCNKTCIYMSCICDVICVSQMTAKLSSYSWYSLYDPHSTNNRIKSTSTIPFSLLYTYEYSRERKLLEPVWNNMFVDFFIFVKKTHLPTLLKIDTRYKLGISGFPNEIYLVVSSFPYDKRSWSGSSLALGGSTCETQFSTSHQGTTFFK